MNSNRGIEVYKSYCNGCNKPFYELMDYELEECPRCGSKDIIDESILTKQIEVSFDTGEIIVKD
ncbi:hypothetical protein [Cytobacillus sp.]|uniref:hypothetical protein n=1 Tax=Cytobacillus sp. TaxID=2675269 RepID=UPI0035162237